MLTEIFVKIDCYNHQVCLEIFFPRQIWLNYANNVEYGKHFPSRFLFSIWTISFAYFFFAPFHFKDLFFHCKKSPICQTHFSTLYLNSITHTFHIELLNITMCKYCIETLTHAARTHSRNKYQCVFTIWPTYTIQFTQSVAACSMLMVFIYVWLLFVI